MSNLARFRADPSKVRVAVRRMGDRWSIRFESRADPFGSNSHMLSSDPGKDLIRLAEFSEHIAGVDPRMQWAYPHPMRTA